MSANIPTCVSDCSTVPPVVNFDYCSPELNYAEIQKVYIAAYDAADFTDVTDLAEWTARLSQDGADPDVIRTLDVIGSKDAPESTDIELSLDRKVRSFKTHTINIKIDDTSAENHNFMRELECFTQWKIWYTSSDGLMWGGNDGIAASITLDEIIPETNEELITFEGVIDWKSKFSPERTTNPLA